MSRKLSNQLSYAPSQRLYLLAISILRSTLVNNDGQLSKKSILKNAIVYYNEIHPSVKKQVTNAAFGRSQKGVRLQKNGFVHHVLNLYGRYSQCFPFLTDG